MKVRKVDHIVLTVKDIQETVEFYQKLLGMECVFFEKERIALKFGDQKLNLHQIDKEFELQATNPVPGSLDLCFITEMSIEEAMSHVKGYGVEIIEGPVVRIGASKPLLSFYFRDPDGNLIEVANEV